MKPLNEEFMDEFSAKLARGVPTGDLGPQAVYKTTNQNGAIVNSLNVHKSEADKISENKLKTLKIKINYKLQDLPTELLIDILLKTNSKKELIDICSTSKRL